MVIQIKNFRRQSIVVDSVIEQIKRQSINNRNYVKKAILMKAIPVIRAARSEMKYGVSVTDACINWKPLNRC